MKLIKTPRHVGVDLSKLATSSFRRSFGRAAWATTLFSFLPSDLALLCCVVSRTNNTPCPTCPTCPLPSHAQYGNFQASRPTAVSYLLSAYPLPHCRDAAPRPSPSLSPPPSLPASAFGSAQHTALEAASRICLLLTASCSSFLPPAPLSLPHFRASH